MRRLHIPLFTLLALAVLLGMPAVSLASPPAYAACNCTAWAHQKRPDLPRNLGNALTWGVRAQAQGFRVNGQPRVGAVMVLQPGVQGAHRRYGHVAYVTAVQGNVVTVSQMNGGQGCRVVVGRFRLTRGVAFIHGRG